MLGDDERKLLKYLPGPVVASDASGVILYANKAVCGLLDYDSPDDLVGRPVAVLMPERYESRPEVAFGSGSTSLLNLLGKRIRMFALTRWGDEQAVELCVRLFRRPDGSDLVVTAIGVADSSENYVDFATYRLEKSVANVEYETT